MRAIDEIARGWTRTYQLAPAMLICWAISVAAHAQITGTGAPGGGEGSVPKEYSAVRDIRKEQRRLAEQVGVSILEFDQDGRSASFLENVPLEFRDIVILDERQLAEDVIPGLYKYYGFTGTETLRFSRKLMAMGDMRYTFQQYINDIEVPSELHIDLDPRSNKIVRVAGSLNIDRGYNVDPIVGEQEAIDLVTGFIRKKETGTQYHINNRQLIKSEIIYVRWLGEKGLQPAWRIKVPLVDSPTLERTFVVKPDGAVAAVDVVGG